MTDLEVGQFEHGTIDERFGAETLLEHQAEVVIPSKLWVVARLQREYLTTGELDKDAYSNVADELGMTLEELFSVETSAELAVQGISDDVKLWLVGRKAMQLYRKVTMPTTPPWYIQ